MPRLGVIDHDDERAPWRQSSITSMGSVIGGSPSSRSRPQSIPASAGGSDSRAALARRDLAPVESEAEATAIVAHNDMQAIATIDRLERSGSRVPDDVSVVGYDDVPLAAHCRIRLTTVRSDAEELGRRAVELLVVAAREGAPCARIASSRRIRSSSGARPAPPPS